MKCPATFVTPPAYNPKKALKRAYLAALTLLFGCRHSNTTIPTGNEQACTDCGAVRDYIFSLRWRKEYKDILTDWHEGKLTPVEFARNFHARLESANAAFIGEWRTGPRYPSGPIFSSSACADCQFPIAASSRCVFGPNCLICSDAHKGGE